MRRSVFVHRRRMFFSVVLLKASPAISPVFQILASDVAVINLGRKAPYQEMAVLRQKLDLNHPAYIRYREFSGTPQ
jgi:hypothetical protein